MATSARVFEVPPEDVTADWTGTPAVCTELMIVGVIDPAMTGPVAVILGPVAGSSICGNGFAVHTVVGVPAAHALNVSLAVPLGVELTSVAAPKLSDAGVSAPKVPGTPFTTVCVLV
jgi:hypothetical protein